MATITTNYGTGEGCLCPSGVDNQPSLASALRDIADDITARSGMTSPDPAPAAGAAPDKAEFDAVVTLILEMKAALNTTVKTIKG
jgi:hypothetical protein